MDSDDIFGLTDDDIAESRAEQEPDFLTSLNEQQRQAVLTTEGPLLVLSGAGTGKTRVLTTRIAYIIAQGLASPWEILAVTFTNKAAREMQERLTQMIGPMAADVWLGTFHRIGLKILTRHGDKVGLRPNFTILNTDDTERLVKKIMVDLGYDVKKDKPADIVDKISAFKDKNTKQDGLPTGRIKEIYIAYESRLSELNAVDFGDLLVKPLQLFRQYPDILENYRRQFRYILVDEYQDTNMTQYLLLRLLSGERGNICCVGDDDQSIYSWRGAQVENILQFTTIYPNATVIRLEQNYRSTGDILACASALIAHNTGRLGKALYVANGRETQSHKVDVTRFYNGFQEASGIANQIQQAQREGVPLGTMAVLVRASFQTREFEDVFMRLGIPYRMIGGFKFYEREEIRDVLAYIRLVHNTGDDLAFLRIVNKPRRGIGPAVLEALQAESRQGHMSLFDAISFASLRPAVAQKLTAFRDMIVRYQQQQEVLPVKDLVADLVQEAGYEEMWRQDTGVEAQGRIENIQELYNVLSDFDDIHGFLEHVSLLTDDNENEQSDKLLMMTMHASKGLEFSHVFLPGWEEEIFPHQKALDEEGSSGLEEERRLAYVALTRAKNRASISYVAQRFVYGERREQTKSRFITELPPEHTTGIPADDEEETERPFCGRRAPYGRAYHSGMQSYTPVQNYHSSRIGRRVYHEQFGQGTVLRDYQGQLEVHFDTCGTKKVLARYLQEIK